jgi:molybdenum cofactor guanylyltransferase
VQISGIILAGGQGRRMGGADKALLPLGGQRLIDHVLARLRPQVQGVALSANGAAGRFADLGLLVLPDVTPQGPLSGVLSGLRWAATSHIVTVAVDTPFFPVDLARRLSAAGPVAMARSRGDLHPTFALWPVALADDLAQFLASGAVPRVTDFARLHGMQAVDFDDGDFHNINAPADLLAAEARLA